MKHVNILFLMISYLFVSCGNDTKVAYKFLDKKDIFECDQINTDLIKEAMYAFDAYANNTYNEGVSNLENAYYQYSGIGFRDRYPEVGKIDAHLKSVVRALKNEDNLWTTIDGERQLNPETILPCIANNSTDTGLGSILNGLISTNSYNKKLFIKTLTSNTDAYYDDKVITTYFILETFYTKLMHLDLDDPNLAKVVYTKNDSIFKIQRAEYLRSFDQNENTFEKIEVPKDQN